MSIAERIISILKERNISAYKMEKDCGLPHSTVHNWTIKQSIPSTSTIIKVASYFNISADYLLGLVDVQLMKFSNEQKELLDIYNKLNDRNKNELLSFARGKSLE